MHRRFPLFQDHLHAQVTTPNVTSPALPLFAWGVAGAHLAVGMVWWRRTSGIPLVPLLNLLAALGVLMYGTQRWIGYATSGATWYWSDQLIPLYAFGVGVLSAFGLAGRMRAVWPHWLVFGLRTLALLSAAPFASLISFVGGL